MSRLPPILLGVFLAFGGVSLSAPRLMAQPTPASGTSRESASASAPERKPEKQTYTLSPEKYQKAVTYSRAKYRLHFISFAYGVLLLLALIALRVAPKFRDWAEAASRRRFVQAAIFVPLLTLTQGLLDLPIEMYRHNLSLRYEQSIQSWGSWFWDWTKENLVGLVIGIPLVWLLYAVIRRSPRRWWFYSWLASLPIIVFLLFLAPVVIQPLFFKFEPLAREHPELVSQIGKVTARGGLSIPRSRMFEMKASEKLKSVNASVTGFGASKRVVVWDTTLEKMTIPQTLFVFGHEMGHYVLRHIAKGIAFFWLVLLVMLYAGYRGMRWALARWGEKWRVRSVEDWASLPVLFLFFALFVELAEPIGNTYSRWREHQADVFGLEAIHGLVPDSSQAAAEAFQILGEINLSDPEPSPFVEFWLYSHAPLAKRLVFAREYDPWSKGETPRFLRTSEAGGLEGEAAERP